MIGKKQQKKCKWNDWIGIGT